MSATEMLRSCLARVVVAVEEIAMSNTLEAAHILDDLEADLARWLVELEKGAS